MPEDRLTYLGIRIHDARKACKLTQQELADETGVSIKMIQCIENGSVNPSYEILFPIVNRLGLTTSDLFSVELNTLDFLAEQLLVRQNEKCKNTERYDG